MSLAEIEAVYRNRGRDFFRLAFARTGDAELAQDAVQEGFAQAIRARRSYRGSGSPEAWIARCVINAAHDARRSADKHAHVADADAGSNGSWPVEATPPDADIPRLRHAVGQLPPRQRDALFLRFYLGLTYSSIAEALDIEIGTVSATLHAARAALARNLQEVNR